jgi:hypothetical protein
VAVWLDLHQHVAGLYIGMDHTMLVRVLQRGGQLSDDVQRK